MFYATYQKQVYDSLLAQYQRDPAFRFSVRQKASKGSERNYFIGTEKSNYFGFTFWDIPVSYPGSASDLVNFMFTQDGGRFAFYFQLYMTKTPDGEQNEADLLFCRRTSAFMKEAGLAIAINFPENRMFYARIPAKNIFYPDVPSLLEAFYENYNTISPYLDKAMAEVKEQYPSWVASRFSAERFAELQRKLQERLTKYAPGQPASATEPEEVLAILENELPMPTYPLNTILYGPPGTGKTYTSITHALAIIEGKPLENYESEDRTTVKERFDNLLLKNESNEGQIGFITFHQSLSYEDFIEGIKPVTGEEALTYQVQPGILKKLAALARYKPDAQTNRFSIPEETFRNSMFYKMSLGRSGSEEDEVIYRWCVDSGYIALGWGNTIDFSQKSEAEIRTVTKNEGLDDFHADAIKRFVHWIRKGDYVLISAGNRTCRAIGRVVSDYEFREDSPIPYHQFRKVEWLVKDVNIPVEEIYARTFSMMSIYQLDRNELKKDFFVKPLTKLPPLESNPKPYVLLLMRSTVAMSRRFSESLLP